MDPLISVRCILRKKGNVYQGNIWIFVDVLPFLEIVIKIGIFQFLWIALSLLGSFLFGVMPVTIGLFTVIRKWLMGNENLQSLVKAYWTTFRKELWKANAIGFVLIFIGFLLYLN